LVLCHAGLVGVGLDVWFLHEGVYVLELHPS
jgi:hypothetical protein